MSKLILKTFCFTDMHNQQAMLDYPTTLRKSYLIAAENSVKEFGKADLAIIGGDNVSDYPEWNKSCALPKKNFIDLKQKLNSVAEDTTKNGKVIYVTGNNDFILGDIGTKDNEPYNTTDFYDCMEKNFGKLPDNEVLLAKSKYKPNETYWNAFHYVVNGIDFIGINIDPDTAFNTHEGYYTDETLNWVKNKMCEIDLQGNKPIFVIGHLSAKCYHYGTELKETMINGNVNKFYDIFKGHKNVFYLYGHIHGESVMHKDYSSCAVLHFDKNNNPLNNNFGQEDSNKKEYEYSFVHMGGLRPFSIENFGDDGLTGYGGLAERQYYLGTSNPLFAQYLVFKVYNDKVVFYVRNTGKKEGFTPNDLLKPYTVYFRK